MNHTEKYYWKSEPDAVSHSARAEGIVGSVEERCKLVQGLSAPALWKTSPKLLFFSPLLLAKGAASERVKEDLP